MRIGSLKTRLAMWVAAVVVLALSANALQLVLTARARLRERLEENARLFARLATEPLCRSYQTFQASGYFRFRQIAEDLWRQAPDVAWFEIRDVEGRRLFHSDELTPGQPRADADDAGLRAALQLIEVSESRLASATADGELLRIVVPHLEDFGRHRLAAVYGVSYRSLDGEVRRYAFGTLLVTLASLGLAAGLGIALARRVTRPLAELTAGAREIARGSFLRRVQVRSGDELEVVGEAFNDMAARVEASIAEVRRSLERWRSLVEGAPVAVLTLSADAVVEFCNLPEAVARRVVGRRLEELAGRALPPDVVRVIEGVRESGQPGSFELELPALRGEGRAWYSIHVGAVREGGVVVGLTLAGIDVTAARAAREERERLIAELERRNAELERFTYTVSHDLRSPLVTVKGFLGAVESAAREGRTERLSQDVARIRAAADRMDQLLRELLELSRVGRVASPTQRVAFAEVVREAIAVVGGRLSGSGVEVLVDDGLPDVWCDRRRLVEVVQNLLDNAAKFKGAQPQPQVRVGCRQDGAERVFTVSDNGIGIEARHHETVFGLFDRLDPMVEGTGVGLALVRRIVEVHGGRVWVESDGAGRGARFCFTLAEPAHSPAGPKSATPSA